MFNQLVFLCCFDMYMFNLLLSLLIFFFHTLTVHASCIDMGKEGPCSSDWQCAHCKTCVVCNETIDKVLLH